MAEVGRRLGLPPSKRRAVLSIVRGPFQPSSRLSSQKACQTRATLIGKCVRKVYLSGWLSQNFVRTLSESSRHFLFPRGRGRRGCLRPPDDLGGLPASQHCLYYTPRHTPNPLLYPHQC